KVQLPFSPIFIAFGVFIAACGMTHFMEVWNIWEADYWAAGMVKVVTALASVATALGLLPLLPRVVTIARAAQLSERRRAELETLYARVQSLSEAKNDFFANVSHELRTPLALILGPAEKLGADERMTDDQRRELGVIVRNARVLLKH